MKADPAVREILDFWFGEPDSQGFALPEKNALWFGSKAADDAQIRSRFGQHINAALAGKLLTWQESAESSMALILLTDQMTRAAYRSSKQAFAGDQIALSACHEGLRKGWDKLLPPGFQSFYYMPLEHSEKLEDQERSVTLFRELLDRYSSHKDRLQGALEYAIAHRDIIARFGRFPHRNAILQRASTAEELDYLREGGRSFGQPAP